MVNTLRTGQRVRVTIEGVVVNMNKNIDLERDDMFTVLLDDGSEVDFNAKEFLKDFDIEVLPFSHPDGIYYCQYGYENDFYGMSNVFKREKGHWYDRLLNPVILTPDQEARMVRLVGEK